MLQPIPARPFFRAFELPLAIAMIGAGAFMTFVAVRAVSDRDWIFTSLFLLGPPIIVFGALALIHSVTGCLPSWVVGDGTEGKAESGAPLV
jgi:hypothetical protein